LNAPEIAPAFILSREGFDVWMGNNRGCKYSLDHVSLNHSNVDDQPLYFDFDYEDMGNKDVPAFIDFILKETGQK
jgi:hypothetical protein